MVTARRPQTLVQAGLSDAKARAIRNLAEWFASNLLKLARASPTRPDDEIITTLGAKEQWWTDAMSPFFI